MKLFLAASMLLVSLNGNQKQLVSEDPLAFISDWNELFIVQEADNCGVSGGDIEKLRFYVDDLSDTILVDYKLISMDCKNPKAKNPKTKVKKGIRLTDQDKELVKKCIIQLTEMRLATPPIVMQSVTVNTISCSDSTILITDFSGSKWTSYEKLKSSILKD